MNEDQGLDLKELAAAHPEEVLRVRVAPADIDRLNKIIEAYDNLALVSTLDPASGEVLLWTTPDQRPILQKLLAKMRFPVEILP